MNLYGLYFNDNGDSGEPPSESAHASYADALRQGAIRAREIWEHLAEDGEPFPDDCEDDADAMETIRGAFPVSFEVVKFTISDEVVRSLFTQLPNKAE